MDVNHARRVASVAIRHPVEFLDRVRCQIEIRRDRNRPRPTLQDFGDPAIALHQILGAPTDCRLCADFESVWSATEQSVSDNAFVIGKGHDAGLALARLSYGAVRHLRPAVVVETGVARGVTSRVILEAMERNAHGHLFSVDLPPLSTSWHLQSAVAVPHELYPRWTYIRGASRRVLPGLLLNSDPLSLFVHDSLHTYANMSWELRTAWRHLRGGGLTLCDDVEDNTAFLDFVSTTPDSEWVTVKEPQRSGYVGVVIKTSSTGA